VHDEHSRLVARRKRNPTAPPPPSSSLAAASVLLWIPIEREDTSVVGGSSHRRPSSHGLGLSSPYRRYIIGLDPTGPNSCLVGSGVAHDHRSPWGSADRWPALPAPDQAACSSVFLPGFVRTDCRLSFMQGSPGRCGLAQPNRSSLKSAEEPTHQPASGSPIPGCESSSTSLF